MKVNILSIETVEMKANCRKVCYEFVDENGTRDSITGGQAEYIDLPDGYYEQEVISIIIDHFCDMGHEVRG